MAKKGGAILLVYTDLIDEKYDEEFNAWYDTQHLPQLPELFTHQPSPHSEGLTWEGADPSKRTGVRRLASPRWPCKGVHGDLRENGYDGESAGWPRFGSDRIEEGRGSTGQGAG